MRVLTKWISMLLVCMVMHPVYAATNDSAVTVKWSYKGATGPGHWADLDPAFTLCATGKEQSPININVSHKTNASSVFSLDYKPAVVKEMDGGTTKLQIGNQYLLVSEGHGVQLKVPADRQKKETLIFKGKPYHLVQFHFHTPSENQVMGVARAGEIHFVNQGEDGAVAVVAVFLKVGATNAALQTILNNLPIEDHKEVALKEPLDITKLVSTKKGAYQFAGSLTTPPCTEGLTWLVMADEVTVSSEQIVRLKKAANGANARPVQSLNKRSVAVVSVEKAQ